MANYGKQMEMFDLGGLKDQGETVDRKSRNKVPVGSLKKEVRDDVPINISEGEFVLPADVVRYHGLEKIMNLRQNAKSGLELMNKMGQMGNSDQATLPDNIPFQPQNYQEGGAIVNPTIQMPQVQRQNQVPGVNFAQPQQLAMRPSVYSFNQPQPVTVTTPTAPTYTTTGKPQYTSPTGTAATPDYSKLVGASFGQLPKSETKRYFNKESGEEMYIPFIDGKPIYPIPAGFVEEAKAKAEEAAKDPTKSRVDTARVIEQGDDDSITTPDTDEYKVASTLSKQKGTGITDALGKIFKAGPIGIITDKLAQLAPKPKMGAGLDLAEAFETTTEAGQLANNNSMARASGFATYEDMAKNYGVNPTFKIGTEKGDVSPITGRTYNYAGQSEDKDGSIAYTSFEDFKNAMKASAATGWYGGTMTEAEIRNYTEEFIDGKRNPNYDPKWDRSKIDAYNAIMSKTYNKVTPQGVKKSITTKNELINLSNKDPEGNIIDVYKQQPKPFGKDEQRFRSATTFKKPFGKDSQRFRGSTTKPDMLAIDPRDRVGLDKQPLKEYFKTLTPKEIGKPKKPIDEIRAEKISRDLIRKNVEDRIKSDIRKSETGRSPRTELPSLPTAGPTQTGSYTYDYYQPDDDVGQEPDSPSSTDIGFSTSQGGFIPKRKKKKVMKRGGLASRK
jgi:hypothetical protein